MIGKIERKRLEREERVEQKERIEGRENRGKGRGRVVERTYDKWSDEDVQGTRGREKGKRMGRRRRKKIGTDMREGDRWHRPREREREEEKKGKGTNGRRMHVFVRSHE